MNNSISIIGGADGPTSIFLGGSLGISWLNIFGLILVVLLLVPNIIYAVKEKNQENKCTNKLMNLVEQIGRYASMFLMVFNIGLAEVGFFICWSLYCLYAWQHIINDFLLDYLGVIFQKESLLETDSIGSYSDLYIFAKWYNNATLFVDYICGYFWNRTFICY